MHLKGIGFALVVGSLIAAVMMETVLRLPHLTTILILAAPFLVGLYILTRASLEDVNEEEKKREWKSKW